LTMYKKKSPSFWKPCTHYWAYDSTPLHSTTSQLNQHPHIHLCFHSILFPNVCLAVSTAIDLIPSGFRAQILHVSPMLLYMPHVQPTSSYTTWLPQ
jgi:hypothetical protein